MIRSTAALLTLVIVISTATTALAQGSGECWWSGCNPDANLCRALCGSDYNVGWRAPYYGFYAQLPSFHRHAKHHHRTGHYGR